MSEMTKKAYGILKRAVRVLREEGVVTLGRKSPFIFPYALLKIKNFNTNSLDELVDFAFNDIGGLIKPCQVRDEILEMLRILDKMMPKTILEIGTAGGGTLFLLSRISSKDADIISIDLPGGFWGGYSGWKIPLYKSFALPKQKIHLIRTDSHTQKTLEEVKAILNGRKIDFLSIDGDHSYKGVKKDFEMYSPLVRNGGIIEFHDIVLHPPETGCEVSKFWSEIKERYKYIEIVKDRNQRWAGIGLLFAGVSGK